MSSLDPKAFSAALDAEIKSATTDPLLAKYGDRKLARKVLATAAKAGSAQGVFDALAPIAHYQGGDFTTYVLAARAIAKLVPADGVRRVADGLALPAAGKVIWHHGDLAIAGNLAIGSGRLIVTGDLSVDGAFTDSSPGSRTIVLGTMRAARMATEGDVIVGRDLEVAGLLFAWKNDDVLFVGGDIRAETMLVDGHHVKCGGKIAAKRTIDAKQREALPAVLADGMVEVDGDDVYLTGENIMRAVKAGKPVLR